MGNLNVFTGNLKGNPGNLGNPAKVLHGESDGESGEYENVFTGNMVLEG